MDYGECQRFIFSFYVKINRDLTEEQNLNEIKSQLENLEEIENLTLIYFKKYFNRLLFNEIVIDFQSDSFHAEVWGVAPRSVFVTRQWVSALPGPKSVARRCRP